MFHKLNKIPTKLLLALAFLLLASIVFLLRLRQTPESVEAGWPPARRAYGSESGTIPYIILTMYYVYLLKSLKDNKYYIGQTNNIYKRLERHNSGLVISTKNRTPFVLIGYETYQTRSESMWREHQLKSHSDKKNKFINALINAH